MEKAKKIILEKFEKAISDYKEVIVINPKHKDAFYHIATIYYIQKDYEKANLSILS